MLANIDELRETLQRERELRRKEERAKRKAEKQLAHARKRLEDTIWSRVDAEAEVVELEKHLVLLQQKLREMDAAEQIVSRLEERVERIPTEQREEERQTLESLRARVKLQLLAAKKQVSEQSEGLKGSGSALDEVETKRKLLGEKLRSKKDVQQVLFSLLEEVAWLRDMVVGQMDEREQTERLFDVEINEIHRRLVMESTLRAEAHEVLDVVVKSQRQMTGDLEKIKNCVKESAASLPSPKVTDKSGSKGRSRLTKRVEEAQNLLDMINKVESDLATVNEALDAKSSLSTGVDDGETSILSDGGVNTAVMKMNELRDRVVQAETMSHELASENSRLEKDLSELRSELRAEAKSRQELAAQLDLERKNRIVFEKKLLQFLKGMRTEGVAEPESGT